MEKFGIFNILSALNSLTSNGSSNKTDSETTENKQQTQKKAETNADLQPPQYFLSSKPMLDIIARHEEISKRIDKNKDKK